MIMIGSLLFLVKKLISLMRGWSAEADGESFGSNLANDGDQGAETETEDKALDFGAREEVVRTYA